MSYFDDVVAAAIKDFSERGYRSQQQLDYWLDQLQNAAEQATKSARRMDDMLRTALKAIYARLVERGAIINEHKGVERFTLQRIAPRLRVELDKRLLASANLIKINRREAINKTLQRFSGWATSLPPGGARDRRQRAEAAEVKKSMKSLPFVERRVLVDQGHKLNASISAVLASDGGAIAARWFSHWRQANYDFRETHKERDGQIYLIRDSWAYAEGLVRPGSAGFTDQITQPGEEPFCFPGDTLVPFADGVEVAYRHWYDGELTEIVTDSGKTLRATPNHPIMTPRGWTAIGALDESDYVSEIVDQGVDSSESNSDNGVSCLAEIFATLPGIAEERCGQREQFHGDGSYGNVDIVWAARALRIGNQAGRRKRIRERVFSEANGTASALSAFDLHGDWIDSASSGFVRLAKITKVARRRFSGHVYNLQTSIGWYAANGIVSHNCRCKYTYLYHLRQLPDDMLTGKGRKAQESARMP